MRLSIGLPASAARSRAGRRCCSGCDSPPPAGYAADVTGIECRQFVFAKPAEDAHATAAQQRPGSRAGMMELEVRLRAQLRVVLAIRAAGGFRP